MKVSRDSIQLGLYSRKEPLSGPHMTRAALNDLWVLDRDEMDIRELRSLGVPTHALVYAARRNLDKETLVYWIDMTVERAFRRVASQESEFSRVSEMANAWLRGSPDADKRVFRLLPGLVAVKSATVVYAAAAACLNSHIADSSTERIEASALAYALFCSAVLAAFSDAEDEPQKEQAAADEERNRQLDDLLYLLGDDE